MKVEIEKGIPFPGYEYPFAEMEVGDSFTVPKSVSHGYMRQLISKAQRALERRRFSLRRVEGGYRCWRVT